MVFRVTIRPEENTASFSMPTLGSDVEMDVGRRDVGSVNSQEDEIPQIDN